MQLAAGVAVMAAALVSLASPELGSLGLSLEKGASFRQLLLSELVWKGVGTKFPCLFRGCAVPRGRGQRVHRQQPPGNVQKILHSLQTNHDTGTPKEQKFAPTPFTPIPLKKTSQIAATSLSETRKQNEKFIPPITCTFNFWRRC